MFTANPGDRVVVSVNHEMGPLSCTSCQLPFATPRAFLDGRRKDGATFYCPVGHTLNYKATIVADETKKLRADLDREKVAAAELRRDLEKARKAKTEAEDKLRIATLPVDRKARRALIEAAIKADLKKKMNEIGMKA